MEILEPVIDKMTPGTPLELLGLFRRTIEKFSEAIMTLKINEGAVQNLLEDSSRAKNTVELLQQRAKHLPDDLIERIRAHIIPLDKVIREGMDTFDSYKSNRCSLFCFVHLRLTPSLHKLRLCFKAKSWAKKFKGISDKFSKACISLTLLLNVLLLPLESTNDIYIVDELLINPMIEIRESSSMNNILQAATEVYDARVKQYEAELCALKDDRASLITNMGSLRMELQQKGVVINRLEEQRSGAQAIISKYINTIDETGKTALHKASENGEVFFVRALIDGGSDVNQSTKNKCSTALHLAARNGHASVAEVLIRAGAAVNQTNKIGWTPLHLAAHQGQKALTEILINAGAYVNKNDDKYRWTPLHLAAEYGHETVTEILINAGADVNIAKSDGSTPLHLAARQGHDLIAGLMIQAGADFNKSTNGGWTPLHLSARPGHEAVTVVLISAGADVNKVNNDGDTSLHKAAFFGHRSVVKVLVSTDVNRTNIYGRTALQEAVRFGHEAVAEVLINAGTQ